MLNAATCSCSITVIGVLFSEMVLTVVEFVFIVEFRVPSNCCIELMVEFDLFDSSL